MPLSELEADLEKDLPKVAERFGKELDKEPGKEPGKFGEDLEDLEDREDLEDPDLDLAKQVDHPWLSLHHHRRSHMGLSRPWLVPWEPPQAAWAAWAS